MFFLKKKESKSKKHIKGYLNNKTFQRTIIGIATLLIALAIINSGAAPKKYKINLLDKSPYDISAPRDIEDKAKTIEQAVAASKAVLPDMIDISSAPIYVLNANDDFFTLVQSERNSIDNKIRNMGISTNDIRFKSALNQEQAIAVVSLSSQLKKKGILLSENQNKYLIVTASDKDISDFKSISKSLLSDVLTKDITKENLPNMVDSVQKNLQKQPISQELKNIGEILIKAILQANKDIDITTTEEKRKEAYQDAINNNKVIIKKDTRVINKDEIVTADRYEILKSLNLVQQNGFDYVLTAGILIILLLLATLLIIFMNHFCKQILYNRNDIILLCIIIILTLLIARGMYAYSALAIPITIAAMLISILLDLKLAIIVNFILTIAISIITKGDINFIYMSLISGTLSAFIVEKADQRNKLFMAGVIVAFINVFVIFSLGLIYKTEFVVSLQDILIVALSGIFSVVLTIGTLPFWESIFNSVTSLKLLELANPNQPLIKRLLMEAPGTYHHSLMVGNLAEVATEAIGGNALLARVGAYFHDVGKLKRPNFFKENQISENPHDRMTANLSTLVVTSHTQDGVELALKYKIPLAIRDIIKQHHGTTMVAYFYHKAKKGEKGEEVKQDNFRYEGPRPSTKEAAVVMLADSVEAAVRAMGDKTEGQVEGLIRKIIKDKLDDGQLDTCSLTLKDLDDIAKSFIKVLSGFFHEREEYPEVEMENDEVVDVDKNNYEEPIIEPKVLAEGSETGNDNID